MKIIETVRDGVRSWNFSRKIALIAHRTEREMDLGTPAGHERYVRLRDQASELVQNHETVTGKQIRSSLPILDELEQLSVSSKTYPVLSQAAVVAGVIWKGLPWAIAAGLLGATAISVGQWMLHLVGTP